MDNTIQKCVCMSRVRESLKPLIHRDLGSDESRAASKTIIEDLEQVAGFGSGDGIAHPIIEDKQVDLGEAGEPGGERAILVRLGQLDQQAGSTEEADGMVCATSREAKRTSEERFS
jgi:predicted RNA-binding protein